MRKIKTKILLGMVKNDFINQYRCFINKMYQYRINLTTFNFFGAKFSFYKGDFKDVKISREFFY